jgi:phage terminase large subunit-like protein
LLVHTKGRFARRAFIPAQWQIDEILAPVFGEVRWSDEGECYVRKHRIVYIELGRKCGKSEILAGILLYLVCADGEESAEIYGGATDRDQAAKVFDVAKQMVLLSKTLSKHLKAYKMPRRILHERSNSHYEVIAADPEGNLGGNPHGIGLDEVAVSANAELWDALRTGMGSRLQPLMVAITTPSVDNTGFGKQLHDEMVQISEDPKRAPHIFTCIRNTPMDADPWDEANWYHANPALGDFLSIDALREEALEAKNDPTKENSFRTYRLAQWVSASTKWMPSHVWLANTGDLWPNPNWGRKQLAKRLCHAGLDLASQFDLTAWCLLFPTVDGSAMDVLWRFWLPESGLEYLDKHHQGKWSRWAKKGWVTVTPGNVTDYQQVAKDIAKDARDFQIASIDADEWSFWPVIQQVAEVCKLDIDKDEVTGYRSTYDRMTPGMNDVMGFCKDELLAHHGNEIANLCFESVTVKRAPYDTNLVRPDKPNRERDKHRIDAVPALAMAANGYRAALARKPKRSAYEDGGMMIA